MSASTKAFWSIRHRWNHGFGWSDSPARASGALRQNRFRAEQHLCRSASCKQHLNAVGKGDGLQRRVVSEQLFPTCSLGTNQLGTEHSGWLGGRPRSRSAKQIRNRCRYCCRIALSHAANCCYAGLYSLRSGHRSRQRGVDRCDTSELHDAVFVRHCQDGSKPARWARRGAASIGGAPILPARPRMQPAATTVVLPSDYRSSSIALNRGCRRMVALGVISSGRQDFS